MNTLAVLIPVKSSGAKSRLPRVLSDRERREFVGLLLTDLLKELGRAHLLASTYVISSDGKILEQARREGANGVHEPRDEGVNAAVVRGIRAAGKSDYLVLPSDLPLANSTHIEHLLKMKASGPALVIVPSLSFNGTNALLFSPRDGLELSYDDDSFWNHLRSAARVGIKCGISSREELMFDVDSPADLENLVSVKSEKPSVKFAREASR